MEIELHTFLASKATIPYVFNSNLLKLQWSILNGSFGICGDAYMKQTSKKFKLNLLEVPTREHSCIER